MPSTEATPLKELLHTHTKEGELYRELGSGSLECYACGHRCVINDGRDGICKIRFNRGGRLFVPHGYFSSVAVDPVEKKPFYHALPGNLAMSFGMLGCDYHCSYCQNWVTSQVLRDPKAIAHPEFYSAEDIVTTAFRYGAKIITSTYNEPLITSEWAVEILKVGKRYGLVGGYVSNGNGTPEVIDYIRPYVDLYKVDLKGFNDKEYRRLGGVLENVLDTIRLLYEKKFWVEIVTLVVPGLNDSEKELREIADFIFSVSPDIPWHVSAFHADYKMEETPDTPVRMLVRAAEIGEEAGLHYVYAGNLPGRVGKYEHTYCHHCKNLLIERWGFKIVSNSMRGDRCPSCNTVIPGFWKSPGG